MTNSSSQLFRRGVVLPRTAEAMTDFQNDSIKDETRYKVASFSSDEQFYRIWKTNVFLEMNRKCNLMIDDHEQTEVSDSLEVFASVIDRALHSDGILLEDRDLLKQMRDLALEAQKQQTSLFLIF